MKPSNNDCALLFDAKDDDPLTIVGNKVPLVRCKDCKHYREDYSPKYDKTMMFCWHCRVGKGVMSYDNDFFCGYGERGDSNNDYTNSMSQNKHA